MQGKEDPTKEERELKARKRLGTGRKEQEEDETREWEKRESSK